MKTFDNESFQIEYLGNVPSSRVILYGNYFKCKSILHKIKKQRNWINSSGKDDLPPDFYSDKYHLMMDAMAINDVEYIRDGKIINDQKKRQHEMMNQYFGNGYRKNENDLRVFYQYNTSLDNHTYDYYMSSFKRVVENHNSKVENYEINHPGYKTIFYIFDDSLEYYETFGAKTVLHICFNDVYFVNIIKQLNVDFVIWFSYMKYVENSKNKEIKIPLVAIYDVKNIKGKFVDYSKYNLQPIK